MRWQSRRWPSRPRGEGLARGPDSHCPIVRHALFLQARVASWPSSFIFCRWSPRKAWPLCSAGGIIRSGFL
eukprot:1995662-Pyramimonas_sp.AAC.1